MLTVEYKLINEVPKDLDPTKQYNTKIISVDWDAVGNLVVELEFLGTEYDPDNPQCLMPLKEDITYHVQPFMD